LAPVDDAVRVSALAGVAESVEITSDVVKSFTIADFTGQYLSRIAGELRRVSR